AVLLPFRCRVAAFGLRLSLVFQNGRSRTAGLFQASVYGFLRAVAHLFAVGCEIGFFHLGARHHRAHGRSYRNAKSAEDERLLLQRIRQHPACAATCLTGPAANAAGSPAYPARGGRRRFSGSAVGGANSIGQRGSRILCVSVTVRSAAFKRLQATGAFPDFGAACAECVGSGCVLSIVPAAPAILALARPAAHEKPGDSGADHSERQRIVAHLCLEVVEGTLAIGVSEIGGELIDEL